VKETIARAKEQNLKVLLDFHYSDTWADPQHQVIPKAWHDVPTTALLADSVYNYTRKVLEKLYAAELLPEFVQVGNEINIEIMQDSATMNVETINWSRNIQLINSGIQAVLDVEQNLNKQIGIMLHIAQPENALWWFREANIHQLSKEFEWIGLSYYPKWSTYKSIASVSTAIDSLRSMKPRTFTQL
jgi:arabinogalactan endo-1,4-beta-galactosidase